MRRMHTVDIRTEDGTCPTYAFRPAHGGASPAVLVYMDGAGIRPAMLDVGERLASRGYFALMPDLFYRSGPYEPMNAKAVLSDPEQRKTLMEKFIWPATRPRIMADTRFFLDYLTTQPDVEQ